MWNRKEESCIAMCSQFSSKKEWTGMFFFFICFFCFVFYHNYMLFTLQKTSVQTYNNATPASGRHAAHQHVCVVCTCACVLMLFFFEHLFILNILYCTHIVGIWKLASLSRRYATWRGVEPSTFLTPFRDMTSSWNWVMRSKPIVIKKRNGLYKNKKKKQKKKAQWEESDV